MKLLFLITIGCLSLLPSTEAQSFLSSLGCSSDPFLIQQTCPLHCDLGIDTFSCSVCVCPPCLICPEPCYVASFSGGLHGECPGCAPMSQCTRFGFFRAALRRPAVNGR